jgi:6-phosphogluconolactonase
MAVGCLNREAPYFQGARGRGISIFAFDDDAGTARLLSETDDIDNPTYLSISPDGRALYAGSEVFNRKEGVVAAYRLDPTSGALTYLNMQPTLGSIAAYNAISADGRFLLLANYGMGEGGPDKSLVAFPILPDGGLGAPRGSVAFEGTGPDAARQERSHAHCVRPLGRNGDVVSCDLGTDRLAVHHVDAEGTFHPRSVTHLAPGAGPRHLVVSPDGSMLFAINELDSTVVSFLVSGAGALRWVSSLGAVPAGTRDNHCADLHLSPDGRFLYASNRGHDSIACFAVNAETAEMTLVAFTPSQGATPRSFCLSPSGRHVLVANQNSDEIVVFGRDAASGRPREITQRIPIGTPMCVRITSVSGEGAGRNDG